MRIVIFVVISSAVFAALGYITFFRSSSPSRTQTNLAAMAEGVQLKTKDNFLIIGDYYAPAGTSAKGLLLLHMMPATRSSWRQFAEKAQGAGWHVLAIDLRGHGESQGGPNGYKGFSDAEHQASRLDVEAGVEFLKAKGITAIALGGASIGANLALQYLAEHPEAKAAFLLSPGLDYRGVKTETAARNVKSSQAVYYAASRDDSYSADTIQTLLDAAPPSMAKEIKFFETAGHGTTIFEKEPRFMDEIVSWLQKVGTSI